MPIDVSVPRSPGWWMQRLFWQLGDRRRAQRLQLLHDYRSGHSPLPEGGTARAAYQAYQRKARTNLAELVTSAVSERMTPTGIRTAVEGDETGDAAVTAMWRRSGMDVVVADTHDAMLALSETYVIVGGVDPETGAPVVTHEDPRWCVGEPDPANPQRLLAGLKVRHDSVAGEDRAYLFLPGSASSRGYSAVLVARCRAGAGRAIGPGMWSGYGPAGLLPSLAGGQLTTPPVWFSPQAWEWAPELSGELTHPLLPMVRFDNRLGFGEYEPHLDLIDRIIHETLQRMVIATMQAFRQRAVKGLPFADDQGREIDYSSVFTADPAALWQLPETAQLWESGQVDLTPILNAESRDLERFSAVTRTPMYMLAPGGVNLSADGSRAQREGLVFKVKDRIARTEPRWCRVAALMCHAAGMRDRADLAGLSVMWAPVEQMSLAERADAAVKAAGDLPLRTRLIRIWGMSPAEADLAMSERADEQLLAPAVAQQQAMAAGAGGRAMMADSPALQAADQAVTGVQV